MLSQSFVTRLEIQESEQGWELSLQFILFKLQFRLYFFERNRIRLFVDMALLFILFKILLRLLYFFKTKGQIRAMWPCHSFFAPIILVALLFQSKRIALCGHVIIVCFVQIILCILLFQTREQNIAVYSLFCSNYL